MLALKKGATSSPVQRQQDEDEERLRRWRRRRLILSKIPECLKKKIVSVHFASSVEDMKEVFHLVYKRYHEVGLIPKKKDEIYCTPYQFFSGSRIAFARDINTGKVSSTATLVLDSEHGLPSDKTYKDILDALRNSNQRLAEYTCLAALPDIYSRNGLLYVLRLLGRYALKRGVTGVVASVHPKHADFYEKVLLFKRMGDLRYYNGLENAPAYLEFLDLANYPLNFYLAYASFPEGKLFYDFFFKKIFTEDEIEWAKEISYQDKKHLFL